MEVGWQVIGNEGKGENKVLKLGDCGDGGDRRTMAGRVYSSVMSLDRVGMRLGCW